MKFVLLFSILIPYGVYAQSLRYNTGFPYIQLSAYSSKQSDVFSFTGNQAELGKIKEAAFGIYGERRFMLQEANSYAAVAMLPTGLGNFGVQLNYAGYGNFNENNIGLAYGKSLGPKLDIGVQFNYYGYRIPAYNSASTINFEGGIIMHFSDKLNGGVHIYNPVGTKLTKGTGEKLASVYSFGLGLDASESFFTGFQLLKEEDKSINVTGGFIYQFKRQFFVRGGFTSNNESGFAGAGVSWKNLRLDISSSWHQQLGFSPGLMLISTFKKKRND